MKHDVSSIVIDIIASQADAKPDQITDSSSVESLGLDSLGMVEIIFSLEEYFDISIPFNANTMENGDADLSNVGNIINSVSRLVAEKDR